MFISCESAVRSVLRPFAPITRPLSWLLARFLGAVNTVSAAWRYTLTHVIRPPVNAVRTSAILSFFGSASRGPSIVASQVSESMSLSGHRDPTGWPSLALIIGILVLMSPLRRLVSAAVAKARPGLLQQ